MIIKAFKLLILLFITLGSLFAANEHTLKDIQDKTHNVSMLSANAVYHLNEGELPSILKPYLLLYKNIIGLKITENIEGRTLVTFFRSNDKLIFNKPIPKQIKSQENITYSTNIEYDGYIIGDVTLYFTTKLQLSNKEYSWLKQHPIINLCIDPSWKPYEWLEKNRHRGFSADYLKLIEERLNISFKLISTNNWEESEEFVKQRKCDLLPLTIKNKKRKEFLNITKPYAIEKLALATKTHLPYILDLNQLKGKKIGITKGYGFIEKIKKNYPNLVIVETKSTDDGLQKIINDEIFGQIDSIAVLNHNIQQSFWNQLKISSKLDETLQMGIATRKDYTILHNILEKTIDNISKNEYDQILTKLNTQNQIKIIEKTNWELIFYILFIAILILVFLIYRHIINKRSLTKFDELLNSTIEGIVISKDGIVVDLNQSAVDIFEAKSKSDIIGKNLFSYIVPESMEMAKHKHQQNSTDEYEVSLYRHNKTDIFPALVRGKIMKYDDLRVSTVIDLTDLKDKDKVLFETSKLAAMGEMIGNIAHQWRQPLTVISTASTGVLLHDELNILTKEQLTKEMNHINDNAQYLSQTIDDFRDFIKGERKIKKFNIEDNIESFLNLVSGNIKSNDITIIKNIEKDIVTRGYPNELIQCLINIFNNAQDVLKEISDERYIFIDASKSKNKITISIKDNAGGIPQNILPKIFEPYFTTKHQSKGTGLGLHMTYNIIVDGMKGTIKAQNTHYEYNNQTFDGAEFIIELPIT